MISSFGKGTLGEQPDQLIGPHGIAVDNEGSVYIAEVSFTAYGSNQDPQREVVSLRKWKSCLLYTSPSPRDGLLSRMPSSA